MVVLNNQEVVDNWEVNKTFTGMGAGMILKRLYNSGGAGMLFTCAHPVWLFLQPSSCNMQQIVGGL